MNRISPVLDRLIGIEDPDELMTEITEVVSDTASAPQAGQFFYSHIHHHQQVDMMQTL